LNLRRQLLLVSLLLLTLPWAGCQFVREIEGALRQGQQQALQATARAVATAMRDRPHLLYPDPTRLRAAETGTSLYASPALEPVIMDGYADGWSEQDYDHFASPENAQSLNLGYQALTRGDRLYLLLRVHDPDLVYHNPRLSPRPNGDRVVLRTWQNGRRQEYVVATVAPGSVRGQFLGPRQHGMDPGRLRGYWQDTPGGYTVELEMPLTFTGNRLGVYVASVGNQSAQALMTAGNIEPREDGPPPWLIHSPPALQRATAPFRDQGDQLQVVDRNGWIVGNPGRRRTSSATARNGRDETFWLLRALYRGILPQAPEPASAAPWGQLQGTEVELALAGTEATRWYRESADSSRTYLSAAAPIAADGAVIGAVVCRESSEEYLTLTDKAFSRLLGYSLAALGIAALGLLGYASLLSWRIGRLSSAAASAIADDGRVLADFPRSTADDEIGELSRNYAALLDQVRAYNDYLRTLSRKLSHELRTPIAVIQSSLDNLELTREDPTGSATYRDRARQGLVRLNAILTAMSEASQLEESIRNNPLDRIDLVPLLQEVFAAYQSIHGAHTLTLAVEPPAAFILGSPDLVVQALDKLLDNAASFCPPNGAIDIRLANTAGGWHLQVCNQGPPLPATLADRLFEPMVSLRDSGADAVHLGLGLHVVRLICDYLGGRATAANLPDDGGVGITLFFPAAD
jgi:dedicated sortase system histidine kinase